MASLHPMDELKEKLKAILEVVPPGSEVIYADYPVYNNGGDLLIMKGTEKFFHDYNIKVRARYSEMNFPDKLSVPDNCIIICQGGGNFGDLYANHQQMREKIVRCFPSHRIVVLPQTIHFENERKADMTAALFNNHPDLHLFVRDMRSYDFAMAKFHNCRVRLCPDMAHQLWPLQPASRPAKDVLYFLRTDSETFAGQQHIDKEADDSNRLDWETLFTPSEVRGILYFQKFYSLDKKLGGLLPVRSFWYKYTDYLMNRAINLFSSYREVRTSRLHGHILSCLLDMPNVVIDNSYGKNSQYYEVWTAGNPKAGLHGAPESKLEQPS
ncbi:polysaccharide pyruvyl transferase family protein [Paenibacillus medicaginis]|uniref:Polysaccharide pyruvyl transferase family protein n=1 Tax=Paenibacillus medicaginis TaxID=1470560 RepID=A0ABV5C2Q7_9BACL